MKILYCSLAGCSTLRKYHFEAISNNNKHITTTDDNTGKQYKTTRTTTATTKYICNIINSIFYNITSSSFSSLDDIVSPLVPGCCW